MSIKIVTGVLGAGKTYFCMHEILNKYFDYDNRFDEWIPKKKMDIITNIHGIKLPVVSLDLEIKKAGALEQYFNVQYHIQEEQKAKIIVIDEAQAPRYFHRKFYNANVFEFFQWSRHLGIDIYFITQDSSTLAKELQNLAEYEVASVRRTYQLGMEFRYNLMVDGEIHKRKIIKKDKRVFAAYRSHTIKETEKIPSAARRNLFVFAGLAIVVLIGGFLFYKVLFGSVVARAGKKDAILTQAVLVKKPQQSAILPGTKISDYLASISMKKPDVVIDNTDKTIPENQENIQLKSINQDYSDEDAYVGYVRYNINGKRVKIKVYNESPPEKDKPVDFREIQDLKR